jgi:small subunit ribosomal protein S8
MSMTDPIADLLTRIRNGQTAGKAEVRLASSKLKTAIVKVLKDEGYIADYRLDEDGGAAQTLPTLIIGLKYFEGRPVIDRLERVSRPGLRIYRGKDELPKVLGGMGTVIVSTPKGVMTDKQARSIGQGGEVLCIVA